MLRRFTAGWGGGGTLGQSGGANCRQTRVASGLRALTGPWHALSVEMAKWPDVASAHRAGDEREGGPINEIPPEPKADEPQAERG